MGGTALEARGVHPKEGTGRGGGRERCAKTQNQHQEQRVRWREAVVLTPIALLLPRIVFPGGMAPCGIAFTLALSLAGSDHLALYALISLLSHFAFSGPLATLAVCPAYFFAVFLGGRMTTRAGTWRAVVLTAAALILGRAAVDFFFRMPSYWLVLLSEGALAAVFALVFFDGIPVLRRGPLAASSEDSLYMAGAALALSVLGLAGIRIFGFDLAAIGAAFLVVLLGYLEGPGLGAGAGLLLSVGFGFFGRPWTYTAGLALGGLFGGLLGRSGRLAVLFGYSLGLGIACFARGFFDPPPWPALGEAMVGMGVFLALPMQTLHDMTRAIPSDRSWDAVKRKEQTRLRGLLTDRVQDLAEIFTQLSKAFVANDGQAEVDPDLYGLLDLVVKQDCKSCPGYDACWRENFYSSYRELFDLIARAEMNGETQPEYLSGRLASFCFQRHKLLSTIDSVLQNLRAKQHQQHDDADNRSFVSDQLEGVASIMSSLAKEIRTDVEFRLEVEDRLKTAFNRFGLSVTALSVLDYGQDMVEIYLRKHECLNYFECQYLIAPLVSRLLGHGFKVWEKKCPRGAESECSITLVPSGRYQARYAAGRLAKDREYCGDSHSLIETKGGRFAALLSDGMGTGRKASQESQATIDLLAHLVESGVNEEFSFNLINSVLMLRTPEERFSTVDAALIDLFKGQVEFLKAGAAPSYIKRGRKIVTIKATAPPAGILRKIEIDRQRHVLNPGDYLILVSDGIFTGELGPDEAVGWVENALSRVDVAGPEPMVDFLLKIAQANMGGEIRDDVTVIVVQLVKSDEL